MRRTVLLLASGALVVLLTSGAALVTMLALPEKAEAAFPGKNGELGGEGEWSPDGTKVVFSRADGSGFNPEVYVKDVASGTTTRLTDDTDNAGGCDISVAEYCPRGNTDPTWSPDSSKIAFVTARRFDEAVVFYLSIMDSDGSDRKVLFDARSYSTTDPAWSPDGKQIAYRQYIESVDHEIRLIDANGTNDRRLYAQPAGAYFYDGAPEWSPDGKRVLFASYEYDDNWAMTSRGIYKANADGSGRTRLVGTDRTPGLGRAGGAPWYAWSPDGAEIAYEEGGEVWTMRPDGSARTNTNAPAPAGVFDWQPLCTVEGTSSNDTLTGTSAGDTICGMGGDDRIAGLGGGDVLLGGEGDDRLSGGPGGDRLFGGAGTDTASYRPSAIAVSASLAAGSATGEGADAFMTVEGLAGSGHADELIGSPGANALRGGGGEDVLRGRGSSDTLAGGGGADRHFGGSGDDALDSRDGVKGNDSLSGGPDTDTCFKDATEKSVAYCEQ